MSEVQGHLIRQPATLQSLKRSLEEQRPRLMSVRIAGGALSVLALASGALWPSLIGGVLLASFYAEWRRCEVARTLVEQCAARVPAGPPFWLALLPMLLFAAADAPVAGLSTVGVGLLLGTHAALRHDRKMTLALETALLAPDEPRPAPAPPPEPFYQPPQRKAPPARSIRKPSGGRCPTCSSAEGPVAWVACLACDAAHHEQCWSYSGGCAIFGCSLAPRGRGVVVKPA